MEIFKIKISPEVLKKDIITQTYSGDSFGYYSGMSYILSAGTTNLGSWNIAINSIGAGNLGGGSILTPLGPNTSVIFINRIGIDGFNWRSYLRNIEIGSTITITLNGVQEYQFLTTQAPSDPDIFQFVRLFVEPLNVTSNIPIGAIANLTITQPNTSQLIDLSIPVLLKQNFEDIGYYSPFDGDMSQFEENINFLLTVGGNSSIVCLTNTTPNKTFLRGIQYNIDWGDGTPLQNVPSSCHTYLVDGNYTITLNGVNDFGNFSVTKRVTTPFTTSDYINSGGTVGFITNNGSWSGTPSLQNYNYFYDAVNTIAGQVSSNFSALPIIVTGETNSRLNELRQYGPNPFVNGRIVTLEDGTTGRTDSQSGQFTAYTINDVLYLDLSGGTSLFYTVSYGLTSNMIVASAMTKFEYLMNVISQPQIQSYVFIERGKNSGVESFRRIGEISNTGDLTNYGYGYFDIRNFDDI